MIRMRMLFPYPVRGLLFVTCVLTCVPGASSQTRVVDRDGDFLEDRLERRKFHTSPGRRDTDRDGILDGDEDADSDGILNKDEYDRDDRDRDGDGLADENERQWGCNLRKRDTDGDGILDGNDNDGSLPNFEDRDDRLGEGARAEDRDDDRPIEPATPTARPTAGVTPTVRITPTPTPRPTSTPRATRTPTPTVAPENCFDGSGNTLEGCFNIPQGMSGNITRGSTLWNTTCIACHVSEKSGSSYSRIRSALTSIPDMSGLMISDPSVADLAAYLNRP